MMREPTRATAICMIAAGLALLGDLLLRGAAWGINVPIFIAAVGAVIWLAGKSSTTEFGPEAKGLFGIACIASAMFAFRDADGLKVANGLVLIVSLSGIFVVNSGTRLQDARIGKWLGSPFTAIGLAFSNTFRLGKSATVEFAQQPQGRFKQGGAVLRGLLFAFPLLLLFGALFASADAIFANRAEKLFSFSFDFEGSIAHGTTFTVLLLLVAGALTQIFLRSRAVEPPPVVAKPDQKVGIVESGIVLTTLNLLFGAFILVQFKYLFGSHATVQLSKGLSYSEYARSGFFELVWVSGLSFLVIIAAEKWTEQTTLVEQQVFRWLGRCFVSLVFVVIASALMRMKIYTDAFGLTELRLYPTVFMVWLALAFAWLMNTALRGRPERFAKGGFLAAAGVIFALNFANPEALIVRVNVRKHDPDWAYLKGLSADATPELEHAMPTMTTAQRNAVSGWVSERRSQIERSDWRELNLSRQSLR